MKTVKEQVSRPSVLHRIATDWIIGGYLQRCLMYSRDLYNIIEGPPPILPLRRVPAGKVDLLYCLMGPHPPSN